MTRNDSHRICGGKLVRIPVVQQFRAGTSTARCSLHGNACQRVPVIDTIQSTGASRVSKVLEGSIKRESQSTVEMLHILVDE